MDESQLEKCVQAVKSQVLPFANIIHVNGVIPECESLKMLIDRVSSEWMMLIDGDMILYETATAVAQGYIDRETDPLVVEYQFGLYDTFIKRTINSCRVSKVSEIRKCEIKNWLRNDNWLVRQMENKGLKCVRLWKKHSVVIGTHFDDPDDFRIFLRHHKAGILRNKLTMPILKQLYEDTSDRRYLLAIKSMEYGLAKDKLEYPGSNNLDVDREAYEKFKCLEQS